MKKAIIPRKDHEVYFFPVPKDLKKKQINSFVVEQLDKLHPAFSISSVFDIQQFIFNESCWIMSTVMNSEVLAEYRILYDKAAFYTNTSITVHKKGFTDNRINIVDDEQIGFDEERNIPVSIPMEQKKKEDFFYFEAELRATPRRYAVFTGNNSKRRVAAMTSIILGMLLLFSIFIIAAKDTEEFRPVETEIVTEPVIEAKYLPPAIEILARISSDVVEAGGKMLHWQYNEDAEPCMEIQLHGIDVLTIHRICVQYPYIILQDIQDVRYEEEEPLITIYMNVVRAEYSAIATGYFSEHSLFLPMFADLSNSLRQQEIKITSETLPTHDNGNLFYSFTYTAKERNFLRSLEIISAACDEHLLHIKKMDISVSDDKETLTVVCSLSQSDIPNYDFSGLEDDMNKIKLAFDIKKEIPKVIPQPIQLIEIKPDPPVVGSIRDGAGQLVFYRDLDTGKIHLRGNND